jgi:hypothetical protein
MDWEWERDPVRKVSCAGIESKFSPFGLIQQIKFYEYALVDILINL